MYDVDDRPRPAGLRSRQRLVAVVLCSLVLAAIVLRLFQDSGSADRKYTLPDGRGVLVAMTRNESAGTSAAEFCVGLTEPTVCVNQSAAPRAVWALVDADDACGSDDRLLYGATTLTASEYFTFASGSGEARTEVVDQVWPRDVAIPGADDADVSDAVETFAACVPQTMDGSLSLKGGYSEDLGANVPIKSDVERDQSP